MAGDEGRLSVAESRDVADLSRFINQPAVAFNGVRLFVVSFKGQYAGGFGLMPQPSGVPELHTDLKVTGRVALAAFRQLTDQLRGEGIHRLTTYVEPGNRRAAMGAICAGFRRVDENNGKAFYEWRAT